MYGGTFIPVQGNKWYVVASYSSTGIDLVANNPRLQGCEWHVQSNSVMLNYSHFKIHSTYNWTQWGFYAYNPLRWPFLFFITHRFFNVASNYQGCTNNFLEYLFGIVETKDFELLFFCSHSTLHVISWIGIRIYQRLIHKCEFFLWRRQCWAPTRSV